MLEITMDASRMLNDLEGLSTMQSEIYSDARSLPNPVSGRGGGFPYFNAVDLGRRGFAVKPPARAIPIQTEGGLIFRKSVGPAAPRNIRQRSIAQIDGSAINAAITGQGSSVRGWFASFLTKMAFFHAQVLVELTPNRSGQLASKYRSTVAV